MGNIGSELEKAFGGDAIATWFGNALPALVLATITFGAFYLLHRLISKTVKIVMDRTEVDRTARAFIQTLLRLLILGIGSVAALGRLGIDTGALLTSLGVVGLTIGFAAKDALSNVISGLFIFWDRPFVLGDLVEVDGRYGRVEMITMRSTRVVTPDGKMLAIPNSVVVNGTVVSYTNFPNLRLDIPITVNCTSDIDQVRAIMLEAVHGMEGFMNEPAAWVSVEAFNDYNIEVALHAWLVNEKDHVRMRAHLRETVGRALIDGGVDLPFETLRIEPVGVRLLEAAPS